MERFRSGGQVTRQSEPLRADKQRSAQRTGAGAAPSPGPWKGLRRAWQRISWEKGPADASYGLDWFALDRWEDEGGLVG
jgi:hypothetical protein